MNARGVSALSPLFLCSTRLAVFFVLPACQTEGMLLIMLVIPTPSRTSAFEMIVECNIGEVVQTFARGFDHDEVFKLITEELFWEPVLLGSPDGHFVRVVKPHVPQQFTQRTSTLGRVIDGIHRRLTRVNLCSSVELLDLVHDHVGSGNVLQLISEQIELY
jgi:hypothetical protein